MSSTERWYDDKIKNIDKVIFGILDNDEILANSALGRDSIGIDNPDLYDNTEPKIGGLIDTRLGTATPGVECATCGFESTYCPGHFGHITLAEPVFHIGYLNYVKKILGMVCLKCSNLLVYKNEEELMDLLKNKSGRARFNEIKNIVKNVNFCQKPGYGCGTPVSKIKKETKKTGAVSLIAELVVPGDDTINKETGEPEGKKKLRQTLTPDICYDILKNISDSDCLIMGFDPSRSRPEMMIHKIFPVSPVPVRPSAKVDFLESSNKEDDLTHKLADIVKANIKTRKIKESAGEVAAKYSQDHTHLLQYHIYTHYDNESAEVPKSEQRNKVTKSLSARLKGKEGRIRSNLEGKRVDFSGRTVITGDSSIEIDQLRVPKKIAMTLTIPEIVTPLNIEKLSKLVKRGREKYPGANFVFPASQIDFNKRILPIDLRYRKDKIDLRFGDIVERHIVDGDYVLLNRQPTLHKLSMMGHRIKVVDNDSINTFGLSVAVTTPYNADFDGDEMNIFLPQSVQTRLELEQIVAVEKNIITPGNSLPIIGIVQDGLLGAYNLSQPSMFVDWKSAMNIISYTTIDDFSEIKKNTDIKGSDLFSMIIPDKINIQNANLSVKNGHIEKGVLNKGSLGAKRPNTLIHLIWDEYGSAETKKFINNTQKLINNFNLWNGFTVGLGDIDVSQEIAEQIHNLIQTKKLETDCLITEMENYPDLIDADTFEQSIYSELNAVRDNASKLIMNNLKPTNNFNIMISSGSKGDPSNMGQMGGTIGQNAVEGKRIQKKLNNRTLYYYPQNDDSAFARGFVREPFVLGANPIGFIFHNMASREGLIDTAIKSVTGDTPIIIMDESNGLINHVLIGDWIDSLLSKHSNLVEHHKERDMELLKIKSDILIPTCDEFGSVSWGAITAITRHDPGKELYEIITAGGRKVIVTESKSLLIWDHHSKTFQKMSTPDVVVGDFVPVTKFLPSPPSVQTMINFNSVCKDATKDNHTVGDYFIELNKENGYMLGLLLSDNLYSPIVDDLFDELFRKYSGFHKHMLQNFISQKLSDSLFPSILNSSVDFIKGFIGGFFSVNTYIKKHCISKYCSDEFILNNICILCNYLGIFVSFKKKLDCFKLKITDVFAFQFAKSIKLLNNQLNKSLQMIYTDNTNMLFANDVVLDPIISINKIDVAKYPKVYDLTVPSTLNFGLANGLHVVDTAESGYIQRKLIKSMEDASVKYDSTVRTANNTILQFIYGDNGLDTTKQSFTILKFLEMGNDEIAKRILFTSQEIKNFDENENLKNYNDNYYQNVLYIRDILRESRLKTSLNNITFESNFMIPVNLTNIISVYKNFKTKTNTKLDPVYVYDRINYVLDCRNTRLISMTNKELNDTASLKRLDEITCKNVFAFAMYEHLSPKISIFEHNLNKEQFDLICDKIINSFNKAAVQPGEMVGIIAAQSIGEPVTQLTLNSIDWKDRIIIKNKNKIFITKIGKFIDQFMINDSNIIRVPDNDENEMSNTFYLDTNKYDLSTISINENGTLTWNKISALTKHLPINKDGSDDLVKIKTKLGRVITATKAKSFLTCSGNKIIPIRGDEIKIGTTIPIMVNQPNFINPLNFYDLSVFDCIHLNDKFGNRLAIDELLGFIFGCYLVNGNLDANNLELKFSDLFVKQQIILFCRKYNLKYIISLNSIIINSDVLSNVISFECKDKKKQIPGIAFMAPIDFVKAFLNAYFSSNGIINDDKKITVSHQSEKFIDTLIFLLTRIKINAIKKETLSVKVDSKAQYTNFTLIVTQSRSFLKIIKMNNQNFDFLYNLLESDPININQFSDIYLDEIVDIKLVKPSKKYVYDLTVNNDKTFVTGSCIAMYDTFHHAGIGTFSTTTLGVPRIKELLSLSKKIKTPVMLMYLEKKFKTNFEIANKIAAHLKYTILKDLRKKIDIYYDPDPFKKDGFMYSDNVFNVFYSNNVNRNSCQADIVNLPWLLRMEMDKEKMLEKNITLLEIKAKFCSQWEKRYADSKGLKKEERTLLEKITQLSILSNSDNDLYPVIHIRFDMKEFDFTTIVNFLDLFVDNFKLKGIEAIDKIDAIHEEPVVSFDNENQELVKEKQIVIYISGVNLTNIRYLNGIDLNTTLCNDVVEVYEKFGIDAARNLLVRELKSVFAAAGNNVNFQHLEILVDIMTNNGVLTSIDRHGMNKSESDPLARASFEKTVDQLIQAAVFGEVDHMKSVSSRIMAGLPIRGGTNICNVILDTNLLENSEYLEGAEQKYVKTFNELSTNNIITDVITNKKKNTDIFLPE